MTADTAQRSLDHWSEDGRAGMDAFYRVARRDYRLLAQALDWRALLAGRRRLLDVACGSGKFPEALLRYAALDPASAIGYDLLDPSPFSLTEARAVLRAPFRPAAEHQCTLQELDPSAGPYDVVWAIHALYALPPAELGAGVRSFLAALEPGGVGAIALASRDAHYLRFYRDFLTDFRAGAGTPYSASEDVRAELEAADARFEVVGLDYHGELALHERDTLEGYLQRCAFDDSVSLEAMERGERLGPYLAACRDEAAGVHRFPQHVDLFLLGRDAG